MMLVSWRQNMRFIVLRCSWPTDFTSCSSTHPPPSTASCWDITQIRKIISMLDQEWYSPSAFFRVKKFKSATGKITRETRESRDATSCSETNRSLSMSLGTRDRNIPPLSPYFTTSCDSTGAYCVKTAAVNHKSGGSPGSSPNYKDWMLPNAKCETHGEEYKEEASI